MNYEELVNYIISLAPSIASVIGVIIGFVKILAAARGTESKVDEKITNIKNYIDTTNTDLLQRNNELSSALATVLQQNADLKKENKELKEQITGVKEG